MNLAEALLAADAGKIKKIATEDYEVKRLSEIIGTPFILHLRQIPMRRVTEIRENNVSLNSSGRVIGTDTYGILLNTLCDGIANDEFKQADVLKHYGAATRKELFEILFNAGELAEISDRIIRLCGLSSESGQVDEIKN